MYAPLSRPSAPRAGIDRSPGIRAAQGNDRPSDVTSAWTRAPIRPVQAGQSPAQITRRGENGQNTALELDRDARAAFDEMRAVLKNQPPWSREVEGFRQKTRNYHQTLIFNHPLHPLSQSLDQLWVRTSYTLIASFREHVARAESALHAAGSSRRRPRNDPADQELRKVLTRFRQALASEEGFYRQFILRLIRFFGMEEICKEMLAGVGLSLLNVGDEGEVGGKWGSEEKKEKVGLVYKALICLGDIERYKEQYSDGYRREKAGGVVAKVKGDDGERFCRARAYYDVARSLVPDDGSAYNQLAVIATYLNDDFSTIYNYFRALAIKVPFKGINEILDKYLKKAFERWSEVENTPAQGEEAGMDGWKKELVVLVAVLYRQNGFSNLPTLKASILPTLSTFLLSRRLPSESIVRLTTITIGLHWHTRSLSSLLPLPSPEATASKSAAKIQQAEDSALDFLLCVFIVLLTISAAEIEEVMHSPEWTSPTDSAIADENDTDRELHTSISAVLRRILPSLRLASKWLKLHFDYLTRYPAPPSSPLETSIPTFWSAYYRLIEALARCFPLGMLPGLESGLEEDEDMRGFLPLSRGLMGAKRKEGEEGDVHPNEEQLMRIADLQVDATLILQAQTSGTNALPESAFVSPDKEIEYDSQIREEDLASVSTGTDDDPVNMAMRVSLGGADRDIYDDEAVPMDKWQSPGKWDFNFQQTPISTQFSPASHAHAKLVVPNSPLPAQNTAFDLLNNLVSPTPPAQPARMTTTSDPASPGLLFGFGGEGIWSMTREESTSQKGLKRDSFSQLDQPGSMSRGGSERARQRGELGAGGVKALWDTPTPGTRHRLSSSSFGIVGNTVSQTGSGDRRVSSGTTQPSQAQPGPRQAPMDAAQLFAGISGLGLGGPSPPPPAPAPLTAWIQQNPVVSGTNHGVIGRPGQSQLYQTQPAYGQMHSSGSAGGYNGYPAWG